jgi:hypothetical protein
LAPFLSHLKNQSASHLSYPKSYHGGIEKVFITDLDPGASFVGLPNVSPARAHFISIGDEATKQMNVPQLELL